MMTNLEVVLLVALVVVGLLLVAAVRVLYGLSDVFRR